MIRSITLLLTVFMTATAAFSQQDAMFTQFNFNKLAINPAYAGSRGTTSFTALYRHQWAGIDGAPQTGTFTLHSPLKNERVAAGFMIINDRLGVTNSTGFYGDYAYRIPLRTGHLSFGMTAGATLYSARLTEAVSIDPGDPNLQADISKWLPNFGFGLYYHSERYFAGLSVPHLINNRLAPEEVAGNGLESRQSKHYFAMGGVVIDMGSIVKFRPSTMIKYTADAPLQADINASFLFADRLWLGATYRTNASADFNIECYVTRQLRVGYAYDYVFNDLGAHTGGSHEVLIGFDLDFNSERVTSPRTMAPRYF